MKRAAAGHPQPLQFRKVTTQGEIHAAPHWFQENLCDVVGGGGFGPGTLRAVANCKDRCDARPCSQYIQSDSGVRNNARPYSEQHHGHFLSTGPDKTGSGSGLGPDDLSPEYGTVRSSLALESEREVERSCRERIFPR